MSLVGRATRGKARQFMLVEELWELLQLGVQHGAPDLGWIVLPTQLTGFVLSAEVLPESVARHAWAMWAELLGAEPLEEVEVEEGRLYLRAVREAYGPRFLRIAIEAELPLRGFRVTPHPETCSGRRGPDHSGSA